VGDERNASDPEARDAISLVGTTGTKVYNVVIDHCSLVWGPDIGGVSLLVNVHDVTLSNNILGEGLWHSTHPEARRAPQEHSMGTSVFQLDATTYGAEHPRQITMHHNLFTTSNQRMPIVIGAEFVDIVNNVIYNWGNRAAHGNPRSLNLIKNMFIPGPETTHLVAWVPQLHATTPRLFPASVYEHANATERFTVVRGEPERVYAARRFVPYSIQTEQPPQEAYQRVIQDAGATWPVRDQVDQRIIDNVVQRTGRFLNGADLVWPTLRSGPAPADGDADGMADAWEQEQFGTTTRGAPMDFSSDRDGDGYTDVEEYLNQTDPSILTR
jgi:hypothetical protein